MARGFRAGAEEQAWICCAWSSPAHTGKATLTRAKPVRQVRISCVGKSERRSRDKTCPALGEFSPSTAWRRCCIDNRTRSSTHSNRLDKLVLLGRAPIQGDAHAPLVIELVVGPFRHG